MLSRSLVSAYNADKRKLGAWSNGFHTHCSATMRADFPLGAMMRARSIKTATDEPCFTDVTALGSTPYGTLGSSHRLHSTQAKISYSGTYERSGSDCTYGCAFCFCTFCISVFCWRGGLSGPFDIIRLMGTPPRGAGRRRNPAARRGDVVPAVLAETVAGPPRAHSAAHVRFGWRPTA